MQIVHVLRAQKEAIPDRRLQLRQRPMRRIRLGLFSALPPLAVKTPHARRILFPCLGRGHVLDAMPLPQPALIAKRLQPALRAHAGAGQHKDAILRVDLDGIGLHRHSAAGFFFRNSGRPQLK